MDNIWAQSWKDYLFTSDEVIQGRVLDIRELQDTDGRKQLIQVQVLDALKGKLKNEQIIIVTYPDRLCPASPQYALSEEIFVILNQNKNTWQTQEHFLKFSLQEQYAGKIHINQVKTQIKDLLKKNRQQLDFSLADLATGTPMGFCYFSNTNRVFCPSGTRFLSPQSTIELKIYNAHLVKDNNGNTPSFSTILSVAQRAINTWNQVPNSFVKFTISTQQGLQNSPLSNESAINFRELSDGNGSAEATDYNGDSYTDRVIINLNSILRWNLAPRR